MAKQTPSIPVLKVKGPTKTIVKTPKKSVAQPKFAKTFI